MTDFGALMWDEAVRDSQAEETALARTAALADAERSVWPVLAPAADEADLGHRLALAGEQLEAVAARRSYPVDQLREDLTRRWRLLAEANAAAAPRPRKVSAAQAEAQIRAVASMTARAAADNPYLPLAECQRLAEEALAKRADANPLWYESWGGTPDGPFTDRAKGWAPPNLPKTPAAPQSASTTTDAPGEGAPASAPGTPPAPTQSQSPLPGGPNAPAPTPVPLANNTSPEQEDAMQLASSRGQAAGAAGARSREVGT